MTHMQFRKYEQPDLVQRRPLRQLTCYAVFALILALYPSARAYADDGRAWTCDCSDSLDCPVGWYCQWMWCSENPSDPSHDDMCFYGNGIFGRTDLPNAANALDLWLQAYETAGANGGGPPDPNLVAAAQAVPLTPFQHQHLRICVFNIVALYLGTTNDVPEPLTPGLWTAPELPPGGDSPYDLPLDDHGSVLALDETYLGVGALIRAGVVGEFLAPGTGVLESHMQQISTMFPEYAPVGGCEYPPPPEWPFPFSDGVDCLAQELQAMVDAHIPASPGPIPTISEWGLIIMTLLLLAAGTIVLGRRRRAAMA